MKPAAAYRNGSTPTVLLVHGGFADGSLWAGVIAELQTAGIAVIALANPLRGLASDAAYITSKVGEIDGPVVLVGHSYGGAVITEAGSAGNVVGLVYVAAFALDDGESSVDIGVRFPGSELAAVLRPAAFTSADGDPGVELYIDRDAFPQVFAADLPYPAAAVAAVAQRPISVAALEEKSRGAAWKTTPCWYLIATADRVIPPEAQRFMARRADAQIIEIPASHAVALTRPVAVAEQIAAATAPRVRDGHF